MTLDFRLFTHWRRARAIATMERLVADLEASEPDTKDPEFESMLRWAEDTLEQWRRWDD